ncbi:MAG TPA: peptidase inhibitor family I36 protein [Vicinamibacterales bacterium]|jgi:hypothetical protein|nr:peptidase inhibitor family I36 protein [Vicinamibacterales bacterium]
MISSGSLRRWLTVGFAAAFCAGLADRAEAQRFGRGPTPNAGACFYRDPDFQGEYFCVRAGDVIEVLPRDMNDQISSIRTFGRTEVRVFQDSRFEGRSARFDDVRNLRREGWNDRISSIRVEGFGGAIGRRDDRDRDRDRDRGSFGNRGDQADRIVHRAYQDILHREPDEGGLRLYRSRIIDDGWSEQQVREALRNSAESRVVTRERASEIVRRAYLSVLNREPDAGAQGYINRVMRDGWTEDDVARELRRSPEFRQGRPR